MNHLGNGKAFVDNTPNKFVWVMKVLYVDTF